MFISRKAWHQGQQLASLDCWGVRRLGRTVGCFLIHPASLELMLQESWDFVKLAQTLFPELPSCEHAG